MQEKAREVSNAIAQEVLTGVSKEEEAFLKDALVYVDAIMYFGKWEGHLQEPSQKIKEYLKGKGLG